MYNQRTARMRAFQRRKGISNENRSQAVLMALALTLFIIVGYQYVSAQRDLTAARVEYTNITEGE